MKHCIKNLSILLIAILLPFSFSCDMTEHSDYPNDERSDDFPGISESDHADFNKSHSKAQTVTGKLNFMEFLPDLRLDGTVDLPTTIDGLSQAPDWTDDPTDQFEGHFGNSIDGVCDVNGDGFADIVIGAWSFDDGLGTLDEEGAVFVYYGKINGLSDTPDWSYIATQKLANFGHSIACAGDVNNDTYDDIIVGAPGWDESLQYPNAGRAFVFHGSANGLSADPDWVHSEPASSNVYYGQSVSDAGDVNGDGYDDVIVGGHMYPTAGGTASGQAYVYYGSASGLESNSSWSAHGTQDAAYFGYSVSGAGDVNDDGYHDVIVGAPGQDYPTTTPPGYTNNSGIAYVFHGSGNGLSTTADWWYSPGAGHSWVVFGQSVSDAGDVNGDDYADVIVGATGFSNGQDDEGRAYVFHGSASGLTETPSWTAESNQTSAIFGVAVSGVGNINGDAYDDVIVGASGYDAGQSNEGRAFVYLGGDSGLSANYHWTGESNQAGANFGATVARAGDVNGDGYDDALVGAPNFDNDQTDEGTAYVYHGSCDGCEIGDKCYPNGMTNPVNICEICNAQQSSSDWSDNDGEICGDDEIFCNGDEICSGGVCNAHTGDPCEDDDLFCNGDEFCNAETDSCDHAGDPCNDDDIFCNGNESCNEAQNVCDHSGDPCPDDLWCNGNDMCDEENQVCEHQYDPDNPRCPDNNLFCDGEESCDEAGDQCISSEDPCEDDKIFCNGDEVCNESNKACEHTGDPCQDDLWCNGSDLCNENNQICEHYYNPENPRCPDDGVFCNGEEICNDADDVCGHADDPCADDGLWCNGLEICDEHENECLIKEIPDCSDDGLWCNGQDFCDEDNDECSHDGNPCQSDGKFCNGDEICDEIQDVCYHAGDPCADDLWCNGKDTCDEVHNECFHQYGPDNLRCPDDGEFCNGVAYCDEEADQCANPGESCPDDGLWCSGVETCDEDNDECMQKDVPECQNDNLWCSGDDYCDEEGDECAHSGSPCQEDSLFCNGPELCNEAENECYHSGDPCADDDLWCNGIEVCDENINSCIHKEVPNCGDDGYFCNGQDYCDEDNSECAHTGNPCQDDLVFCNGDEICDEMAEECIHSGDPCADDGFWCNGEESCNEDAGLCDLNNVPDCEDDGLYCNGAEYCDEFNDQCASSAYPCQDDGVFCNGDEICDEEADTCLNLGDPCADDGFWCTGAESCDEDNRACISEYGPNSPRCSDDGLWCSGEEFCDEEYDVCANEFDEDNPRCALDGHFCNGEELCDEELHACVNAGNPCPDDAVYCNGMEICDEGNDYCLQVNIPCENDGYFCNGEEIRNEENRACDHSGNPCLEGEMCMEDMDLCSPSIYEGDGAADSESSDDDDDEGGGGVCG